MTFYFSPPSGNISLLKLQEFCEKRLKFIIQVHKCNGDFIALKDLTETEICTKNSDCVISGTVKDSISHFLTRLALSSDHRMSKFFVKAETDLFSFRFSCMNEAEKLKFFKSLQRRANQSENSTATVESKFDEVLNIFKCFGRSLSLAELASHCFEGRSDVYVSVPYLHALNLVSKRCVELNQGIAKVPCSKLHEVITGLFQTVLINGLKHARCKGEEVTQDVRMRRLFQRLQHIFKQQCGYDVSVSPTNHVLAEEIDDLSRRFPLCMSHLHRELRAKHRLTHHARIQYTLFLKETGLPVHEAIKFWGQEYSQQCCHGNGCTHNWNKDEKRYTYNIRHLYGLEGSRINYRGHSCSAIQDAQLGPRDEGGCPYIHFDDKHLTLELELEGLGNHDIIRIKEFTASKKFEAACKCHFVETARKRFMETAHNFTSTLSSSCVGKLKYEDVHDSHEIGVTQVVQDDSNSEGVHKTSRDITASARKEVKRKNLVDGGPDSKKVNVAANNSTESYPQIQLPDSMDTVSIDTILSGSVEETYKGADSLQNKYAKCLGMGNEGNCDEILSKQGSAHAGCSRFSDNFNNQHHGNTANSSLDSGIYTQTADLDLSESEHGFHGGMYVQSDQCHQRLQENQGGNNISNYDATRESKNIHNGPQTDYNSSVNHELESSRYSHTGTSSGAACGEWSESINTSHYTFSDRTLNGHRSAVVDDVNSNVGDAGKFVIAKPVDFYMNMI